MTDLISRKAVLKLLQTERDAAIRTSDTYGDDTAFGEDEDAVYAQNLDLLIGQVEAAPTARVQIVANISGGVLQGASATHAVELFTLDFENDDDPVVEIEDEGSAYRASCFVKLDPTFVQKVIDANVDA